MHTKTCKNNSSFDLSTLLEDMLSKRKINDHSKALVQLETWAYNSPYLKILGKTADMGAFAEAFIYYDSVYVVINTPQQLEEFVEWFDKKGKILHLIELIKNKKIIFFYYSFMSSAIYDQRSNVYSIWNMNFTEENNQSDFIRLVLNKSKLHITRKERLQLLGAIQNNFIDEKASDYESIVTDARNALQEPAKIERLVQPAYDEIYKRLNLGKAPKILCTIQDAGEGKWDINLNVDHNIIDHLTEKKLGFRREMPLIGEVNSNRLIWTGIQRGYDLFLGNVMSQVVGNKLEEAEEKINKTATIITELQQRVEFPNIREEVNRGALTVEDVFVIRINADRFRKWLQQEGKRDRDAFFAYHNEITKASGITRRVSTVIKLFGNITANVGGTAYQAITRDPSPQNTLAVAGLALGAGEFLKTVADSIGQDWKPVVFGEYAKAEVEKRINRKE